MASITPGKVKRRVQAGSPRVKDASEMSGVNKLQAGVERGASEINRGLQNLAKGVEDLGKGIQASRDRIQLNQDKVHALEIENGITADSNQLMNDIVTSGEDPTKMLDHYNNGFQSIQSRYEAEKSDGSRAIASEKVQALRLKQTVSLQNKILDLQNQKKVALNQQALENSKTSVQNNPTVHNYMGERMMIHRKIDTTYHLPAHAKDALKQAGDDSLGRAFFMGQQPQTSVELMDRMKAELQEGKNSDENAIYGSMTTDAREELEKDLRNRAKAFRNQQEEIDKDNDDKILTEAYKTPGYLDDSIGAGLKTKDGLKAFATLQDARAKKIDKALAEKAHKDLLVDTKRLSEMSLPELIDEVRKGLDPKDLPNLLRFKKEMLDNPSAKPQVYKEVIKSLQDDFNNGKFGDGSESELEFVRQIRDFQEWALANPKEDPSAYYEEIIKPYNISLYERIISSRTVGWTDPRIGDKPHTQLRREALKAQRDPAYQAKRQKWIDANREANPEYTDAELSDYYDDKMDALRFKSPVEAR